jgi:hypothetical protein
MAKKLELEPCYKCGGRVEIFESSGGAGTGDLTSYRAECMKKKCGMELDELSDDGTRRDAIRQYNAFAKKQKTP